MGLVGLLFVPSLERRFGKVSSATAFNRLWPNVPVVDASHQSKLVSNVPLAWKRSQANVGGSATFLGFPDDRVAGDFIIMAGGLADTYDAVTILGSDTDVDEAIELWSDNLFLVVDRKQASMHDLTMLRSELETLGLVPQTVILHGT